MGQSAVTTKPAAAKDHPAARGAVAMATTSTAKGITAPARAMVGSSACRAISTPLTAATYAGTTQPTLRIACPWTFDAAVRGSISSWVTTAFISQHSCERFERHGERS
jgi:hypothetical protein